MRVYTTLSKESTSFTLFFNKFLYNLIFHSNLFPCSELIAVVRTEQLTDTHGPYS